MTSLLCRGAIFDLDGVITQTARIHFKAWKKTFDEYLKNSSQKTGKDYKVFNEEDYLIYVDGKPRYQGVKSFLESRDIDLPFGKPSDSPNVETICGIGNKKNDVFCSIVESDGVEVYQSTISLIKKLKAKGMKVGVASSSRNCKFILEKTGLVDLFEVIMGGIVSNELELKGKPAPDIFVIAADSMGIHPNECMMVEDAISGVEAGKNGNFALVVGVARKGDKEALKAFGADIVVEDMKEISIKDIEEWFKEGIKEDNWNLSYHGFKPEVEKLRETLTTVGNGYFGTRGCLEWESAHKDIHYPGTYIAGVYNKLSTYIHKKKIYNNDFVNCPNWLSIEMKIGKGQFMRLLEMEILDYKQNLNMKEAVMSRIFTVKDEEGRITRIESYRIASMHNPHYGAIKYKVTPQNYDEKVTIKSTLDGSIINYGVPRYRDLKSKHLDPVSEGEKNGEIYLHVQTNTSGIKIFINAKTAVYQNNKPLNVQKRITKKRKAISEEFSIDARSGVAYTLEKLVSIYTSKDRDVSDPGASAESALSEVKSFDGIFKKHKKAWNDLWDRADFRIEGDRFSQRTIRLHIYHLLVTASIHNKYIDAGMPARGLHGEAYRGHVFWDEIFVFHFYNLHFPDVTRALLVYRYRRLDAARKYAKENGYEGAMYPWQTADEGSEETQIIHYNPVSHKWDQDLSRLQRHVSIAIAYNVWEYCYCTNDLNFLYEYGAELMIEIARFWASAAKYDEKDGRYHISGVMGPDEFHERYPDAEKDGLKDNAHTNIMVSWLVHKTIETVGYLPEKVVEALSEKIGFQLSEIEKWEKIVEKMNVIITENNVLSQFDGYMDLLEIDWDRYEKKYGDIHRMDRILKSEGDSPDNYKVAKQADVLMTFYLLSPGQIKNILRIMGYTINDDMFMEKNYEYYLKRTSHGSTLSYIVHSAILKYMRTHKKHMWEWYLTALKSDVCDVQGGTTLEGIHAGVMGGTVDTIIKSFAGISIYKDSIELNPSLPLHWNKLSFKVLHRNNLLNFTISKNIISVNRVVDSEEKISICVDKKDYVLEKKKLLQIPYKAGMTYIKSVL